MDLVTNNPLFDRNNPATTISPDIPNTASTASHSLVNNNATRSLLSNINQFLDQSNCVTSPIEPTTATTNTLLTSTSATGSSVLLQVLYQDNLTMMANSEQRSIERDQKSVPRPIETQQNNNPSSFKNMRNIIPDISPMLIATASTISSPVGVLKTDIGIEDPLQPLPVANESSMIGSKSLGYPSSSDNATPSSFNNQYYQNPPQLHQQPRSSISQQSNSLDPSSVQFQFPLNNSTTSSSTSSTNPSDPYYNYGTSFSSSSSQSTAPFYLATSQQVTGLPLSGYMPSQQLPQLSFPIPPLPTNPGSIPYLPAHPMDSQQQQQPTIPLQGPLQPQLQQQPFQRQEIFPPMSSDLPNINTYQPHPRAQSYSEPFSTGGNRGSINWSLETPRPIDHKQEDFNEEDIKVLRSLLLNGEKVKWRYVSSKLSVITGRRATATACCKKTRELFKIPSEKASGSLGSSIPYAVHNSWASVIEDDLR